MSILNKKNRQASINDHLRKTATCQQRRARIPNQAKTTTILRAYPWTPSDWGTKPGMVVVRFVCLTPLSYISQPKNLEGDQFFLKVTLQITRGPKNVPQKSNNKKIFLNEPASAASYPAQRRSSWKSFGRNSLTKDLMLPLDCSWVSLQWLSKKK